MGLFSYFNFKMVDVIEMARNFFIFGLSYGISKQIPKSWSINSKLSILFVWNLSWWIGAIPIYYYMQNNNKSIKYINEDKSKNIGKISDMINIGLNILIITLLPLLTVMNGITKTSSFLMGTGYAMAFIFLEDVFFYIAHIMLHNRYLYKHIHYVHHQCKIVHPLYAQYAHPIEGIINGSTLLMTNLILNLPFSIYFAMSPLLIVSNVSGHAFPTGRHGIHHLLYNYNYGALEIMDNIFSTNRQYLQDKS